MMKKRFMHLSMLVAAVLLVGAGCGSVEEAPVTGDAGEVAPVVETGDTAESSEGSEAMEMATETFMHDSGAYAYVFDPAKYETTLYVSSKSVSLDDISGERKLTALQVFTRAEGDDKLTDDVMEKATSATPEFVKPFGTMSVYAAKSSTGDILEIKCQKKNCEEVLPMLEVK